MAWDFDNPEGFMDNDNCDVDHHCDHRDQVNDHYDGDDHISEDDDHNKSWGCSSKWLGTLIILNTS